MSKSGQGKNTSSIATSDDCISCGRCCRSLRFWINHDGELGDRIRLLNSPNIQCNSVEGFVESSLVQIDIRCSRLTSEGENYRCEIYGRKERPKLCDEFPDNLFDSSGIEKPQKTPRNLNIASVYREYCPAVARHFFTD